MPFVPYPVGDVTDPYADCEDCGAFDSDDPYVVSGYTADPYGECGDVCNGGDCSFVGDHWYIEDSWNPFRSIAEYIIYNGGFYAIQRRGKMYEIVGSPENFAFSAQKAPNADDTGTAHFHAIDNGNLAGLYASFMGNGWAATRLFQWNETDDWTGLSASANESLYGMEDDGVYLYVASGHGIKRWDGTNFEQMLGSNTELIKLHTFNGTMYASAEDSTLYSFDTNTTPGNGTLVSVASAVSGSDREIKQLFDYKDALWMVFEYNDGSGQMALFKLVGGSWNFQIDMPATSFDKVVELPDEKLYTTWEGDLYRWAEGDGSFELVASEDQNQNNVCSSGSDIGYLSSGHLFSTGGVDDIYNQQLLRWDSTTDCV